MVAKKGSGTKNQRRTAVTLRDVASVLQVTGDLVSGTDHPFPLEHDQRLERPAIAAHGRADQFRFVPHLPGVSFHTPGGRGSAGPVCGTPRIRLLSSLPW